MGERNSRLSVRCSRSATTVATLPPKQLKKSAAPIKVAGAAFSKAIPIARLFFSETIKPFNARIKTGKIAQAISDRRLRHNSVRIRPATASVSFQYFIFYLRGMEIFYLLDFRLDSRSLPIARYTSKPPEVPSTQAA
jgi:hypothetical protein